MPKTLFVSKTETVSKYVDTLCRALEEDYKQSHLRSMERMHLESASEYTRNEIQATKNGTAKLMRFRVQSGRKYYKIIQQDYDTFQDRNEYRDGSVHAFVEKTTGDVYKPAGWAKPAQHVRYNLIDDKSRENCLLSCDWAGGYLYMR
ncbi:MAG: hypothetical protein VYE26_02935 [Pseudomonadota bacterium]|nr:hypothetical protein [Pseudomonadota bacterium]